MANSGQWWGSALLVALLASHFAHPDRHREGRSHRSRDVQENLATEIRGRRMEGVLAGHMAKLKQTQLHVREKNTTNNESSAKRDPTTLNVTLPCMMGLNPCGPITLPAKGYVRINSWIGPVYILGYKDLAPQVHQLKVWNSIGTAIICLALIVAYLTFLCCMPENRKLIVDGMVYLLLGKMDDEALDDYSDTLPLERLKVELNVDSANFIAPGNIYRVVAVLHPGHTGVFDWMGNVFKACTVAYMQLYLPLTMVSQTINTWEFMGAKSPIWNFRYGLSFLTQAAALTSLTKLFQERCANNIRTGARANYFILSHLEPVRPPMNEEEEKEFYDVIPRVTLSSKLALALSIFSSRPQKYAEEVGLKTLPFGGKRVYRAVKEAIKTGDVTKALPPPVLHPFLVKMNALVFCWLSMFLNVAMSLILQIVMTLKVATFQGDMTGVALISVSLMFVFDLDKEVIKANPRLQFWYRRKVSNLTFHQFFDPSWMNRIGLLGIYVSAWLMPIGCMTILFTSWRNTIDPSIVIGGDEFTQFE
eukprot:TRINITY_DN45112_c0_g1_i1.p1 TRINITY_DN45112_c0_g1~~TRINITY_DN45112_c0_g1_i1.p1  ORF type:complete len:553 (-),score=80.07 TRINITY_DN45112_c0_g1_i1:27-1625(-)